MATFIRGTSLFDYASLSVPWAELHRPQLHMTHLTSGTRSLQSGEYLCVTALRPSLVLTREGRGVGLQF